MHIMGRKAACFIIRHCCLTLRAAGTVILDGFLGGFILTSYLSFPLVSKLTTDSYMDFHLRKGRKRKKKGAHIMFPAIP